ncbi:rhodanese-like domain-containing protein [Lactobacillus sp. LL6]|uniref:rhodanese-like domain-containing protein n=1 Tax=Lactobacillus sp. LL6 TaxID=2596827 RepID=UPI0011866FF6|nr:rhodanese-like domain-containing protein [Lactobacillus sp. LL6]TSO26749.1 rhodanese-like domain-containing protein [Lactobacillus sp. LL6]
MKEISTNKLMDLLNNKNINLIDVRTEMEYAGSHIPEAQNFPLEEIAKFSGNKNQPYYLICRSGNRSSQAAAILELKGYEVTNVQGGMLDWHGKTISEL